MRRRLRRLRRLRPLPRAAAAAQLRRRRIREKSRDPWKEKELIVFFPFLCVFVLFSFLFPCFSPFCVLLFLFSFFCLFLNIFVSVFMRVEALVQGICICVFWCSIGRSCKRLVLFCAALGERIGL